MYEIKKETFGDSLLTNVYWNMEGVTPVMIDWFFSNMERGYNLWHPNQHMEFGWFVDQSNGPIGSIHWATEVYGDGVPFKIYLRMERPEMIPKDMQQIIQYDHLLIVGCMGFDDSVEENYQGFDTPPIFHVMHQWKSTDEGVTGISTQCGPWQDDTTIWAQHSAEETGNWENFLPGLYTLYRVIDNREINPLYCFGIEGKGSDARYKHI